MVHQLPPLRFEDGDVIIKLSADPNRHLLLHRDLIRVGLPTLGPALKPVWNLPETIKHPLTEKEIDVYSLALKSVEHTVLLEGKELDIHPTRFGDKSFPRSDLAMEGWPEIYYDEVLSKGAGIEEHAHHALFALLYGYDIPRWSLRQEEVVDPANDSVFNHASAAMAVIILSYAEYYGGSERVAPLLLRQFESYGQSFWEDVALRPKFYIMFAAKIQNSELYSEALRQLVTQNRPQGWNPRIKHHTPSRERTRDLDPRPAPEVLGMTADEYADRFQSRLGELDLLLHELEYNLLSLQLHTYQYPYDRFLHRAGTSFLNLLSVKGRAFPKRPADVKAAERYDFLARSLWGQWLVQQLAGQVVYCTARGDGRAEPAGPFNTTCRRNVEAAASDDPSRVIGYKCASRLSSIFRLGFQYQAERQVKNILDEVVREASRKIEYAFFPNVTRIERDPEGQKTEDFIRWRQYRYAEVGKNFTYLAVNDSDFPWGTEWDAPPTLLEVDRSKASEEWLEAVGLVDDVLPTMWQELLAG
ncbi:hypothetical protein KC345_g8851 [Hortaea werneckii]|nr:hypothetical protein KC345_g8851 [Hortaea werneckii]